MRAAEELSTSALLEKIVHSTKYVETLQAEGTEEAESRIENIRELLTAAEESHERGEKLREGTRRAYCMNSDVYWDFAKKLVRAMASSRGSIRPAPTRRASA